VVDLSKRYTTPYDSIDLNEFEIHSVSTFLKSLIGGFPEAIIPDPHCFDLYDLIEPYQGRIREVTNRWRDVPQSFNRTVAMERETEIVKRKVIGDISEILRNLSRLASSLLFYLLTFLRYIALFSHENLMGCDNLSLLWGPLVCHPTDSRLRVDWIMGKKGSAVLDMFFALQIPNSEVIESVLGGNDGVAPPVAMATTKSKLKSYYKKKKKFIEKRMAKKASSSVTPTKEKEVEVEAKTLPLDHGEEKGHVGEKCQPDEQTHVDDDVEIDEGLDSPQGVVSVYVDISELPISVVNMGRRYESVAIHPKTTAAELCRLLPQLIVNGSDVTISEIISLCSTYCLGEASLSSTDIDIVLDDVTVIPPTDCVWGWRVGGECVGSRLVYVDQILIDKKIKAIVAVC
jgi:hypothetical protein